VNEHDSRVPFALNGTLSNLTFYLGPMQLTREDRETAAGAFAVAKDWPYPSYVPSSRASSRVDERGSDARAQPGGGWLPHKTPSRRLGTAGAQ